MRAHGRHAKGGQQLLSASRVYGLRFGAPGWLRGVPPREARVYLPYCLTELSIAGPALARSCGFMTGRNQTFALKARNQGSATAGISEGSCMSKTIAPERWPSSSAKK